MNKKGFTLIEVLAVFAIIAIIGGIGLISYRSFSDKGQSNYYKSLESDLVLAGNDYFQDNRDLLTVVDKSNEY